MSYIRVSQHQRHLDQTPSPSLRRISKSAPLPMRERKNHTKLYRDEAYLQSRRTDNSANPLPNQHPNFHVPELPETVSTQNPNRARLGRTPALLVPETGVEAGRYSGPTDLAVWLASTDVQQTQAPPKPKRPSSNMTNGGRARCQRCTSLPWPTQPA